MTIYEDFGRAEAPRRGITADVAIWAWAGEGGWDEPARRGTFATGSSWWSPQLHYGGPGYEQYGTTAGMGTGFTKLTGWPPGHPAAWRDAIRYGLDQARLGGWGPWYAAKARGITGFYGIDRSVPWSGTPDNEWDFKKGIPPMTDMATLLQQMIALGKTQTGKPYSGPIVDQPESARWGDPGFDCLIAGTLITTDRGAVPIERIRPGDRVLTRAGYRPVIGAWFAGERETFRLRASNGAEIVGTAGHRVWSDGRWKDLSTLIRSDTLLVCDPKLLSSMASATTDTPSLRAPHTESTFSDRETRSTVRSGALSTGLSPTGTRFTTSTTTPSITIPQIWTAYRHPSTDPSLPTRARGGSAPVPNAARSSWPNPRTSGAAISGSARGVVPPRGDGRPDWIVVPSPARNAAPLLSQSTSASSDSVATGALLSCVSVIGKPETAGTAFTYDLEVEGEPEFFANGILVHNCSSFVSWLYSQVTGGQIKLTAFTDAAYGQCSWQSAPQPGDIVFYHYADSSQPGVTYPHMGIWLSPTETLDCRYPEGVGIHPHVTPVSDNSGRYRKTMRPIGLESVVVAPGPTPTPSPDQSAQVAALTAQVQQLTAANAALVSQLGYAKGDVADALQAAVNTLRGIGA